MGRQNEGDVPTVRDLSFGQTNELRERLRGKSMIMIDECGTMTADVLGIISERLQGIFKDGRPFGGMTVILFGDFNQLQPIGLGLPTAALLLADFDSQPHRSGVRIATSTTKQDKYAANSYVRHGVNVFTQFRWQHLKQQVRSAQDPVHQALIDKMHRGEELDPDQDFCHLKLLTAEDLEPNSKFFDAPILVSSNLERMEIIELKARIFAKQNSTCVIRWQKTIKDEWVGEKPTDVEETIHDSTCCWEYFVAGAKGHILHNFNQSKDIVNGAEVVYHSVTFANRVESDRFKAAISCAQPGQIITVGAPLVSVNVELLGNTKQLYSLVPGARAGTLANERLQAAIIPIRYESGNYTRYKSFNIQTKGGVPCTIQVRQYFEVDLAFAMTVHKAQGKTLDEEIIAVDERPAGLPSFTYAHLLVALSRVRKGDDLRILTAAPTRAEAFAYIKKLRPNGDIKAYFDGYSQDNSDRWNAQLALASWVSQKKKTQYHHSSAT
jgi:hypothetical protein